MQRIISGVMNWGVWGSDLNVKEMSALIEGCLESGVQSFDHADIYGGHTTEATFGKALKEVRHDRTKIEIITKCGIMMPSEERPQIKAKHYNTSYEHICASVDQSLSNLGCEYIDLLLIHRPSPLMDIHDVAKAFDHLQSVGKVGRFGVSNFTTSQVNLLQSVYPLHANQVEVSLLETTPFIDGTLDQCILEEIECMAWSPLGGGHLFGDEADPSDLKRLYAVADKYDWTLDQMAYIFLLHHPAGIAPVVGSSKLHRIKTAVDCLSIEISDEQWFEIYTAALGHEVA